MLKEPTVIAVRKDRRSDLRKDLATDLSPRATRPKAAESRMAFIRASIDEVDESAAIVVFTFTPYTTDSIRANWSASQSNFRDTALLSPGGQRCGVITSAACDDGGRLACTADITDPSILEALTGGQFRGIEAICLSATGRSGGTPETLIPSSIRLLASVSGLNPEYPIGKSFSVRRADGRLLKRGFAGQPNTGAGVGSGAQVQIDAFKKIHAGGKTPLSGDALSKLSSTPGKAKLEFRREHPFNHELRKAHGSSMRKVFR